MVIYKTSSKYNFIVIKFNEKGYIYILRNIIPIFILRM